MTYMQLVFIYLHTAITLMKYFLKHSSDITLSNRTTFLLTCLQWPYLISFSPQCIELPTEVYLLLPNVIFKTFICHCSSISHPSFRKSPLPTFQLASMTYSCLYYIAWICLHSLLWVVQWGSYYSCVALKHLKCSNEIEMLQM